MSLRSNCNRVPQLLSYFDTFIISIFLMKVWHSNIWQDFPISIHEIFSSWYIGILPMRFRNRCFFFWPCTALERSCTHRFRTHGATMFTANSSVGCNDFQFDPVSIAVSSNKHTNCFAWISSTKYLWFALIIKSSK